MAWKMAEKCSTCKLLKDKKCKGVSFSIEIISLYCKEYEKIKGGN